jgi:uncharacterized membrane protein
MSTPVTPPPIPPPIPPSTPPAAGGKSGTGLDRNLAAMLSYLLGFITGLAFLVLEKEDRYVRFHAMQSVLTFGGLFALNILLGMVPILGWIISFLLLPVTIVIWLVLMFKAYQGEKFKLPYIGDLAEQQVR